MSRLKVSKERRAERDPLMQKTCRVCEEPIKVKKGDSIPRCAVCKQAVCNYDRYTCGHCGNHVCRNDVANLDDVAKQTGTRLEIPYDQLFCKSCDKAIKRGLI